MAKLGISTGSTPNDGTGDSLLDGAVKVNTNFTEIYTAIGDGTTLAVPVTSVSAGTGINVSGSTGNVTITNTGIAQTANINADTVSVSGVVTATSFVGSGANITGISTLNIVNYSGGGGGSGVGNTNNLRTNFLEVSGISTLSGGLTVAGISTFSGDINLNAANVVLGVSAGSSDDRLKFHTSEIYQDTLAFRIISNTGGINLRGGSTNSWTNASGAEEYIIATENGSVDLYYDNSKKLETTTSGVTITGESKSDSITLEGRSFSISPSGSQDVTFQNTFTGGSIVQRAAGDVRITSYQGSILLKTNTNTVTTGGLSLYYSTGLAAEVTRLTTTSNGVDINGNLNVSSNITVGSGQSFGSSTGSAAVYYGDGSNLTGVGGGGGLSSRSVVTATTGSVSVGATTNLNITGFKSYGLLKIGTSAASWVRLYVDDTSRTSDANRSYLEDPLPGSGLIAEARSVSSGSNNFIMTPGIVGWNNDSTPGSTIYLSVTNNETSSSAITVDLTVVKLED